MILKGKRPFWGQPNQHYHQGMLAGDNTLNVHCARVLIRTLTANRGHYDKQRFLDDYIDFMTAYPPRHPDTYAESYHRGFFANLESGKPRELCAAKTHDTPSVGGLITGEVPNGWFDQLTQHLEIKQEINALLATSTTEG